MHPCLVLWSIDVERSVLRACYKNLFLKRLCSAGGSVKRYSRYGKPYCGSSKKLKTELLQDPQIPFLDIYLNEICVLRDISTCMLMEALMEATQVSIKR